MNGIRVGSIANIPIWVSPWYLLLLLWFSRGGDAAQAIMLAGCVTVSLLVHEFGHATMAKIYDLQPQVIIHGFGGACQHAPARRDRDLALIVAAGPGAGLLLGGLVWVASVIWPATTPGVENFYQYMMGINFIWSIFNLVPMWPLDGGHLYRLAMIKLFKPARGERITHITGLAIIPVIYLLLSSIGVQSFFMMFILAMLGFQNWQALRNGSGAPATQPESKYAKELVAMADNAFKHGDYMEAQRLCHQARSEGNVPKAALDRCWTILGICATQDEKYEEALTYLKRAPESADTVEATAQCLYSLHMDEALQALTQGKGFRKLSSDKQQAILSALAEG